MKPRDWFIVGLRLLGTWVWVTAISDICTLLDIRLGYFQPQRTANETYYMLAVQHILVGSYLLFFGHHLAGLIYREPRPEAPKS